MSTVMYRRDFVVGAALLAGGGAIPSTAYGQAAKNTDISSLAQQAGGIHRTRILAARKLSGKESVVSLSVMEKFVDELFAKNLFPEVSVDVLKNLLRELMNDEDLQKVMKSAREAIARLVEIADDVGATIARILEDSIIAVLEYFSNLPAKQKAIIVAKDVSGALSGAASGGGLGAEFLGIGAAAGAIAGAVIGASSSSIIAALE